jgi:hypothetical protein
MAEEEAKKVEVEVAQEPEAAPAAEPAKEAKEDVAEEKAVIPASEPPVAEEKPADDSKALAIVESEYYLLCFLFSLCTGTPEGSRWEGGGGYWSVLPVLGIGRNLPPLYAWFVVSVLSGSCTVAVLSTCDLDSWFASLFLGSRVVVDMIPFIWLLWNLYVRYLISS